MSTEPRLHGHTCHRRRRIVDRQLRYREVCGLERLVGCSFVNGLVVDRFLVSRLFNHRLIERILVSRLLHEKSRDAGCRGTLADADRAVLDDGGL
jgi:hypothetical protein